MALAYALWNLWSRAVAWWWVGVGAIFGGAIVTAYFVLHKIFAGLLDRNYWLNSQLQSLPGGLLVALVLVLFLLVLVLQTELPQWANRPFIQSLYVHARNGFYFNTLANRAIAVLWPGKTKNRQP
jgi:NAD(P)H-quinone oxidoreductase subunit 5